MNVSTSYRQDTEAVRAVTKGLRLEKSADQIVVGEVVRKMEPDFAVFEFSLNKEETTMTNCDYYHRRRNDLPLDDIRNSIQPGENWEDPIATSRRLSQIECLWSLSSYLERCPLAIGVRTPHSML